MFRIHSSLLFLILVGFDRHCDTSQATTRSGTHSKLRADTLSSKSGVDYFSVVYASSCPHKIFSNIWSPESLWGSHIQYYNHLYSTARMNSAGLHTTIGFLTLCTSGHFGLNGGRLYISRNRSNRGATYPNTKLCYPASVLGLSFKASAFPSISPDIAWECSIALSTISLLAYPSYRRGEKWDYIHCILISDPVNWQFGKAP